MKKILFFLVVGLPSFVQAQWITFSPIEWALDLKDWFIQSEAIIQATATAQQAIQMVQLAAEAKRIMGDPEGALLAAGWALGIDDAIAEALDSPSGIAIRKTIHDSMELKDALEDLDYAWQRFEDVEAGSRDMSLYRKYAKMNQMANRFLHINRTHPSMGILGERMEEKLYDELQMKLDRVNSTLTTKSQLQLMAEMDALINQSTSLYHQRARAYWDMQTQKIMDENEEKMVAQIDKENEELAEKQFEEENAEGHAAFEKTIRDARTNQTMLMLTPQEPYEFPIK